MNLVETRKPTSNPKVTKTKPVLDIKQAGVRKLTNNPNVVFFWILVPDWDSAVCSWYDGTVFISMSASHDGCKILRWA